MAAPQPYRFIGVSKSGIYGTKYEFVRFGQSFSIDPDIMEPLIGGLDVNGQPYGGFLAVPESVWLTLDISEMELIMHAGKVIRGCEPAAFAAKKEAAWKAHMEYIKSKHTPATPEPAVEAATPAEKE